MKKIIMSIVVTVGTLVAVHAANQPNIVFFLIDDMGWKDSEAYGSAFYKSPAQMRLKNEGMMFTEAHVAPLCSPTRASILSGKYPARLHLTAAITRGAVPNPTELDKEHPFRFWAPPQNRDRLPLSEWTIAEELREQGYQTWFMGKWHIGHVHKATWPDRQGFEKVVGVGGPGPGSYFSPYHIPKLPNGPKGEHIADRMAIEAGKLLENRDKDKPFFLYFCDFSVHSPYEAEDHLVQKYKKTADPENPQRNPVMAAMLESMDRGVGKVLNKLDELGLAEDTLVVFVGDNGGVNWSHKPGKGRYGAEHKATSVAPITSNYPLRGGKASIYEGGVRVPLLVRWPGVVKPGSTSAEIVNAVDFYPTLLDAAGAPKPEQQLLDGDSMVPLLKGETVGFNQRPMFCHFPNPRLQNDDRMATSVRLGDWKLIRFYGETEDGSYVFELYNIKEDISESKNLAEANPAKVKELDTLISKWVEETGAQMPRPNRAYDPAAVPARKARFLKPSCVAIPSS